MFTRINPGESSRSRLILRRLAPVAAVALSVLSAQSQNISLTDQNSAVQINVGSQMGMHSWLVDGQQQLFQQWFWYRVGGVGAEYSIDTISAPAFSATANSLSTTYTAPNFNINVLYTLRGAPANSGVSDMTEQITINNTSGGLLSFHFFQYSDFDLGGTVGGQVSSISRNTNPLSPNFNKFTEADQVNALLTISETVTTPGADHGDAGLYPATLNSLNDLNSTTLADTLSSGPGDATWALQWDLTLNASGPGSSVIISKDKHLTLLVIPEPSALALLSLAFAGFAFGRRQKKA